MIEGRKPMESKSSVKADLKTKTLKPSGSDLETEKRAYSGIWEGWMCRNATFDVKVAVFNLTQNGATVAYAQANDSRGKYGATITTEFDKDGLKGKFSYGAELILGMREDGNMNIMWKMKSNWCSGVLKQTMSPPAGL